MQKRNAIAALTDELAALIGARDSGKRVLLSGPDGASLNLSVGWVREGGTGRRTGAVIWLFRELDGLTDGQADRATAAFARIGRGPVTLTSPDRPPARAWFVNLAADAGIAAEAAVGFFATIFRPLENDYRVTVQSIAGNGMIDLPDDGRPVRSVA